MSGHLADNFPGHRVDGRFAGRDRQTGLGDQSHSLPPAKHNFPGGRGAIQHPQAGSDQGPMRYVRIIPGIFDYSTFPSTAQK
jgi:hypothetical protein